MSIFPPMKVFAKDELGHTTDFIHFFLSFKHRNNFNRKTSFSSR